MQCWKNFKIIYMDSNLINPVQSSHCIVKDVSLFFKQQRIPQGHLQLSHPPLRRLMRKHGCFLYD